MLKSLGNRKNVQPRELAVTLQKSKEKGLGFLVKKKSSKPHVVISEILKGRVLLYFIYCKFFNLCARMGCETKNTQRSSWEAVASLWGAVRSRCHQFGVAPFYDTNRTKNKPTLCLKSLETFSTLEPTKNDLKHCLKQLSKGKNLSKI